MKIFVINMKSSVRRRKIMERQLNRLGLPFEIFEAVQGDALTEQETLSWYEKDFYNNRPSYHTNGMVGCTLTHYLIYKKITEQKIARALILEDDMILGKTFPSLLNEISKKIRNDEVIMLFYQSYFPINLCKSSQQNVQGEFSLYQVNNLKGLRSTAAYIITYEAAKSMMDGYLPISFFPDDWKKFFDKKLLNGVRLIYPFIVTNAYEPTTISPNLKGGKLMKYFLSMVEKLKIFPIYQALKYRRKMNTKKSRQCFLINEPSVDFREKIENKHYINEPFFTGAF
ncbi:MAG: glycosyltransferase family 25 protein [Ginsengibacter sp.]